MTLPNLIFALAVLLLILTKVINFIHLDYVGGYWDIDRMLGLWVFLWVVHRWIEPLKGSSLGALSLLFGLALTIDYLTAQLGVARILQLLVLTSLVEEILLRGVLFEILLKKLSPRSTLLLTTLVFTAVHAQAYHDGVYAIALVLTGLLLGGAYLYFRRYNRQTAVLVATGLHMAIILIGVNLKLIA